MNVATLSKKTYLHPFSGVEFFCFNLDIESRTGFFFGSASTCWMNIDPETNVLHDSSYGIDDDCHHDETIYTSPAVNIPKPCDYQLEQFDDEIYKSFSDAINKHLGYEYPLPFLCNAEDAEVIHDLKESLGYEFKGDDFYKSSNLG